MARRRLEPLSRALAATTVLLTLLGCGKKAPLRLPDQTPAERAAPPHVRVREGVVLLTFQVPRHRVFPEREEPWVLARILRRQGATEEYVEAGAILESKGLAFEERLEWSEPVSGAGPLVYQVEFRDAQRRRRAISEAVTVPLEAPLAAPAGLAAAGDDRSVTLSWSPAPAAATEARFRVYRRAAAEREALAATPEAVAGASLVDTRVETGREYCYALREVRVTGGVEVEGPASAEVCALTEDTTPPPPPGAVHVEAVPGAFLVTWAPLPATDLLGYRVYRAVGDGPLELLTPEAVAGTVYRNDTPDLAPGTRCRFAVTAVDRAARRNESPFSATAEAAVPAK